MVFVDGAPTGARAGLVACDRLPRDAPSRRADRQVQAIRGDEQSVVSDAVRGPDPRPARPRPSRRRRRRPRARRRRLAPRRRRRAHHTCRAVNQPTPAHHPPHHRRPRTDCRTWTRHGPRCSAVSRSEGGETFDDRKERLAEIFSASPSTDLSVFTNRDTVAHDPTEVRASWRGSPPNDRFVYFATARSRPGPSEICAGVGVMPGRCD